MVLSGTGWTQLSWFYVESAWVQHCVFVCIGGIFSAGQDCLFTQQPELINCTDLGSLSLKESVTGIISLQQIGN